jgi:NAD dependent epimerase/dehydratase family enzyme
MGVYNVCAPSGVTNALFMATLRQSWQRPWTPPAPAFLVKLAARYLMKTDSTLILGGRVCVPRRLLAAGFQFDFPDLAPALRHLARSE